MLKYYCKFVFVVILFALALMMRVVVVFVIIAFTLVNYVVLTIQLQLYIDKYNALRTKTKRTTTNVRSCDYDC